MWGTYVPFDTLIGKTITHIDGTESDEVLTFYTNEGTYQMQHHQDCCESVTIDDIVGSIDDLIGTPVVWAEESSKAGEETRYGDSSTWTFYHIRTIKGTVTIRWYGTSNGYYSESVSFERIADVNTDG